MKSLINLSFLLVGTLTLMASTCTDSSGPVSNDAPAKQTPPIKSATENLFEAIEQNDLDATLSALRANANLGPQGASKQSPLHVAALLDQDQVATMILKKMGSIAGPDKSKLIAALNCEDISGESPLFIAAKYGHLKVVHAIVDFVYSRQLLLDIFLPNVKKAANQEPGTVVVLMAAVKNRNEKNQLLSQILLATINEPELKNILDTLDDQEIMTIFPQAFFLAINKNNEKSADFVRVANGFTMESRKTIVKKLLDLNGTNPFKDRKTTILKLAKEMSITEDMLFPLDEGEPTGDKAPKNKPNPNKQPPKPQDKIEDALKQEPEEENIKKDYNAELREGIENNNMEVMAHAIVNKANLFASGPEKETPLHIAAREGKFDAISLLLRLIPSRVPYSWISETNAKGKSALGIAMESAPKNSKIIVSLIEFYLRNDELKKAFRNELRNHFISRQTDSITHLLQTTVDTPDGPEQIAKVLVSLATDANFSAYLNDLKNAKGTSMVFAQAYYLSLTKKAKEKIDAFRTQTKGMSLSEKKNLIGGMLYLNLGNVDADFRGSILDEAEKLSFKRNEFTAWEGTAARLKAELDDNVIGQDRAKVALAVAVANHYDRVKSLQKDQKIKKSNILIVGPSGSGKTLIVETIAKHLNVPFAAADASSITQAGYVGGKVEDVIEALAAKTDYDKGKIEKGIVFFDEIDKMAARAESGTAGEFKRSAQANMLKLIEGTDVTVKLPGGLGSIQVNTSNMLFICAGAFSGLDQIIKARLDRENKKPKKDIFDDANAEDIIAYGLTPEMAGRMPNLVTLKGLSVEDMIKILKNPRTSVLEEYRKNLEFNNIDLVFTDEAISAIAKKAFEQHVGARALRIIVTSIMNEVQYRLAQMGKIKRCTINERVIELNELPMLEY